MYSLRFIIACMNVQLGIQLTYYGLPELLGRPAREQSFWEGPRMLKSMPSEHDMIILKARHGS